MNLVRLEALEHRLLLANQFVGNAFTWGGAASTNEPVSLALHPDGYLATLPSQGGSKLYLQSQNGAVLRDPAIIHPSETITSVDQVASDASGNAVVVWVAHGIYDSNYDRGSFQLFSANGAPRTGIARVHSTPISTNDQNIRVDMAADGRFV